MQCAAGASLRARRSPVAPGGNWPGAVQCVHLRVKLRPRQKNAEPSLAIASAKIGFRSNYCWRPHVPPALWRRQQHLHLLPDTLCRLVNFPVCFSATYLRPQRRHLPLERRILRLQLRGALTGCAAAVCRRRRASRLPSGLLQLILQPVDLSTSRRDGNRSFRSGGVCRHHLARLYSSWGSIKPAAPCQHPTIFRPVAAQCTLSDRLATPSMRQVHLVI